MGELKPLEKHKILRYIALVHWWNTRMVRAGKTQRPQKSCGSRVLGSPVICCGASPLLLNRFFPLDPNYLLAGSTLWHPDLSRIFWERYFSGWLMVFQSRSSLQIFFVQRDCWYGGGWQHKSDSHLWVDKQVLSFRKHCKTSRFYLLSFRKHCKTSRFYLLSFWKHCKTSRFYHKIRWMFTVCVHIFRKDCKSAKFPCHHKLEHKGWQWLNHPV